MIGNSEEVIQWLFQQDRDKQFEIKEYKKSKKRSLNANSYMWVLCNKIAEKLHTTKENVYREQIKSVGQFEIIPVKNEAVDKFISAWCKNGLGWICEVVRDSKIDGYTNLIAYYGSSTYDNREMSILIDEVVQEAVQLNIEVMTPDEIEKMKALWN